jgi:O-antigen/teichoic acid export membrane protein
LRRLLTYGAFALAILVAEKLRFQSDAMVIAGLLSTTAITSFSIASRLVEYASYSVRSMAIIFTPMSSQFHAVSDFDRLRRTFVAGNRACALIIFPLCATLIILGKPIIASWVGAKYVGSYSVLVLLLIPRTVYLAQSTSTRILLGMGRHRWMATVLLIEGVINLGLSLLLARPFGIVGVALGTAIPMACTSLFFLPTHLCRTLNVPLRTFLVRAYRFPLAVCVPLVIALWLMNRESPAHSNGGLLLQLTCGSLVYGAGLAISLFQRGGGRPRSWRGFAQILEPKAGPD